MGARVRIAILVAVTTGALGLLPAGAASGQVSCGSITTDVRLDADLICGDGIAVTIDADRVTLDLNGHNIFGSVVVEGHDRATIEGRDGFVSGSVELRDAHRVTVRNVQGAGLVVIDSSRNLIEGNRFAPEGISMARSDRNLIRRNDLLGFEGPSGLSASASDRNEIVDNIASALPGFGIAVGGSHNWIAHNTAFGDSRPDQGPGG